MSELSVASADPVQSDWKAHMQYSLGQTLRTNLASQA